MSTNGSMGPSKRTLKKHFKTETQAMILIHVYIKSGQRVDKYLIHTNKSKKKNKFDFAISFSLGQLCPLTNKKGLSLLSQRKK